MDERFTVHPATPERWPDLEALFGPRGACAGCWCMFFRQTRSEFSANKGEPNRLRMKGIVDAGEVPGLVAYDGATPVGWVSVAPREQFSALQRSRSLKPVDDRPVWSVVCFFVHRKYRRRGLTVRLLQAAAEYVRSRGGTVVEGYPVEPATDKYADVWAYTGVLSAFRKAGFKEAARPSGGRAIMRLELDTAT